MYRVHLTEEQRGELQRRTHAPGIMPRTRDRLERVRLADAGWSVPRIARHLRRSESRVRFWIKRFLTQGFDALPDQPHVGQSSGLPPALREAVRQELSKQERTWTAPQLADWLAEQHGLRLSPAWLSELLDRAGLSYKRTYPSLKHKQDPAQVIQKQADLLTTEKGETRVAWTSAM